MRAVAAVRGQQARQFEPGWIAARTSEVQIRLTHVRMAAAVQSADEQIADTIAVDISDAGKLPPCVVRLMDACEHKSRVTIATVFRQQSAQIELGRESACTTEHDHRTAGLNGVSIEVRCADQHISESVAVDIRRIDALAD